MAATTHVHNDASVDNKMGSAAQLHSTVFPDDDERGMSKMAVLLLSVLMRGLLERKRCAIVTTSASDAD